MLDLFCQFLLMASLFALSWTSKLLYRKYGFYFTFFSTMILFLDVVILFYFMPISNGKNFLLLVTLLFMGTMYWFEKNLMFLSKYHHLGIIFSVSLILYVMLCLTTGYLICGSEVIDYIFSLIPKK